MVKYCLAMLFLCGCGFAARASLPLSFEENRGQSAQEVRFLAVGSPDIFFTQKEAVIAFTPHDVLRIRPQSARASAPEALGELQGKSNYLNREPSITGIPHYSRVMYRSVYPGIDLVYHGRRNQLEYDFEVAPGARAERIRLSFGGANELHVDAQGNLVVGLHAMKFLQKKPDAWQGEGSHRRPVDIRYLVTRKQEIAFVIGAYDHTRPLIIDPLIDYVTDFGTTSTDGIQLGTVPYAIAADSGGNAYITGDAVSGQLPITIGTVPSAIRNTGFVAKLSPDGSQLVYSTYLNLPRGQTIAVDAQGSAYVAGGSGVVGNGFVTYIVKLTPDGSAFAYNYSFSSTSGGTSFSHLVLDSANNAYVLGNTFNYNFPTTPGVYQPTFPGKLGLLGATSPYGVVVKLNASGGVAYSTYLRDAFAGNVTQLLAVDGAANAIIVTNLSDPGSGLSYASTLIKLNGSGREASTTTFQNANTATSFLARGITADSAGNLYLAGNGPGFAGQTSIGPDFLVKFDPSGSVIATKSLPFSGDLHLDGSGNAYVVAAQRAIPSPGQSPGLEETPSVARVTGSFSSVTTVPLTATAITDQIQSAAVDSSGNVYVVLTPGDRFGVPPQIPTTPNAYQTTGGGLAVLKADAAALATAPTLAAFPVTNAASGEGGIIAPAEIVAIYGANLGPAQLVSASLDASGKLPTSLAGTRVLIAGEPLPLLYASASQVGAIVFGSLSPGRTTLQVEYQGVTSPAVPENVVAAVPGLFTADASGHGQGAIVNQDGSINSSTHPAAAGSVFRYFAAGAEPLYRREPTARPRRCLLRSLTLSW